MALWTVRKNEQELNGRKQLTELRIANMEHAIKVLSSDELKQVIEKFDGKVYNKRFDTALKSIDKYIRAYRQEYSPETMLIEFYFYDRRYITVPRGDYSQAIYLDYDKETIYIDLSKEDYRINKEQTMERINKKIEGLKEYKEQLKQEINYMDKMINEYNLIVQQTKDFEEKYSYEMRHALGLTF